MGKPQFRVAEKTCGLRENKWLAESFHQSVMESEVCANFLACLF